MVHKITLSAKFIDHSLSHRWEGHRELRIKNDRILIDKMIWKIM